MDFAAIYLLFTLIGGLCVYAIRRLTSQPSGLGLFDPLACFLLPYLIINVFQPMTYFDVFELWNGRDAIVQSLFEVLLALLCILFSYWFGAGPKLAGAFPASFRSLWPRRLEMAALLTTGLGVMGWGIQIALAGGIDAWGGTARGGTQYSDISGYVLFIASLVDIAILVGLVASEVNREDARFRSIFWALSIATLLWYVYIGSRSRTVLMLFTMGAAYYLPRQRHPGIWPLLVLPIVAILSNLLAEVRGAFRDFNFYSDEVDLAGALGKSLLFFSSNDSTRTAITPGTEFNVVMTVINLVPESVSYAWGYPLLEVFTRPIPRALWDGKFYPMLEAFFPIYSTGMLTATPVEYGQTELLMGPAIPFVGFWHLNGGVLGVVIGGLLTGTILRAISELYRRSDIGREFAICTVVLMGFQVGFTEGAATPFFWAFVVPPQLLVLFLVFRIANRGVSLRGNPQGSTAQSFRLPP